MKEVRTDHPFSSFRHLSRCTGQLLPGQLVYSGNWCNRPQGRGEQLMARFEEKKEGACGRVPVQPLSDPQFSPLNPASNSDLALQIYHRSKPISLRFNFNDVCTILHLLRALRDCCGTSFFRGLTFGRPLSEGTSIFSHPRPPLFQTTKPNGFGLAHQDIPRLH